MVNVYKGKGDALECGLYRGIKLLEHVLKILERVIDARVRRIVKVHDMQFGFMAGKVTTHAIFVHCGAKKRHPFYLFNNSVKNRPILKNFGTGEPEEIWHQRVITFPTSP